MNLEDLLKLINGSIDCVLDEAETVSKDNQFDCLSYGNIKARDYATVPNIEKEVDSVKECEL